MASKLSRRSFIKGATIFTLNMAVGVAFAGREKTVAAITTGRVGDSLVDLAKANPELVMLNAWLKIDAQGLVTVAIPKADMGQGVRTSLAMLVADEMEVAWENVRVEQAIADGVYGSMLTAGSGTIVQLYNPMRLIGATARHMLTQAAAQLWSVDAAGCRAEAGKITAPDGKTLSYVEVAAAAAKLPVPPRNQVKLKEAADYKLIGKPTNRIDNPDVVSGKAEYGLDVKVPGMLYATVLRSPAFGGKVASVDDTAAKAIAGVKAVVQISTGVAVVGENTWAALSGRDALKVTWAENPNATLGTEQVWEQLKTAKTSELPPPTNAAKEIQVAYELPYLAHATMEPMNCTADIQADRAEVWAGTQSPDGVQRLVANKYQIPLKNVIVHTTLLGGGFGRRVEMDFITEAIETSAAVKAPVKVMFTRADDMKHGYYRPASYHVLRSGLTAEGKPTGWSHRVTTSGVNLGGTPAFVVNFIIAGGTEPPYDFSKFPVDIQQVKTPIPVGFWRSVYASQNVFAVESFMDELAATANRDPYEIRLENAESPRMKAVLQLAAEKSNWAEKLPSGKGRGIACLNEFGTYVATVVELTVAEDGVVTVDRVTAAIDCGVAVNPRTVDAQISGAIVDGLSTALMSRITIANGGVEQSSFRDFQWFRMRNMPVGKITVHQIASNEAPGGIGEVGYPSTGPAVANAIFAATGKRLRRLPMQASDILDAK